MKMQILLSCAAVALSIGFSQSVVEAKKDVIVDVQKCRETCYANAKKCAEAGNVSVANCVATKKVCLENLCGDKSSATSGTPEPAPPADGAH